MIDRAKPTFDGAFATPCAVRDKRERRLRFVGHIIYCDYSLPYPACKGVNNL